MRTLPELRSFLADRAPVEAVKALAKEDPLDILMRVDRWMRARCFLLDHQALVRRSWAHIVAAGPTIPPDPPGDPESFDEWIADRIESAGDGLIEEDKQAERNGDPVEEPLEPRMEFLASVLHFRRDQLRTVLVAVNRLPTGERHVFMHCLLLGKGFGRYGLEMGIDGVQARRLLERAVDRLSDAVGDL